MVGTEGATSYDWFVLREQNMTSPELIPRETISEIVFDPLNFEQSHQYA